MNPKRLLFIVSTYYTILFMGNTLITSYISLYYDWVRLTEGQIGVIAALGALVSLGGQPIWGRIADRSKSKNGVVMLLLICVSATIWLIPLSGNAFWLILAAVAVYSFFAMAINTIGDSVALELASREGFKFSMVRTAGSLGFAVMAAVAGFVIAIDIRLIFVMFTALRLLSIVVLQFVPKVPGHEKAENPSRMTDLFKDKKLVVFYIYVFLLSCAMAFVQAFHAIYSRRIGIPEGLLGVGIMIGSLGQFPFMLLFDKIRRHLGMTAILLLAGVVYTLRPFLYLAASNEVVFILNWVIYGGTFMPVYLCMSHYVSETVPPALRTRGQVMNSFALFALSTITGSSLGGLLSQNAGLETAFIAAGSLCAAATLAFLTVTRGMRVFREPGVHSKGVLTQ